MWWCVYCGGRLRRDALGGWRCEVCGVAGIVYVLGIVTGRLIAGGMARGWW